MSRRFCRQYEENSLNKDITGGLLLFSTCASVIRNRRVFLSARPERSGITFSIYPKMHLS